MYFVMNVLFHRRIYKPFRLLSHHFVTARRYNSVRTFKAVRRSCSAALCRPLSVLAKERTACCVYCTSRRHLSDDLDSHEDRFATAADGRWSNRCNCCGLNSKGLINFCLNLPIHLCCQFCPEFCLSQAFSSSDFIRMPHPR